MRQIIIIYLPWILSANTVVSFYLIGEKYKNAWLVSLFGSTLWTVWIISSKSWGLAPMNVFLIIINIYNHWKWTHEANND